jgi:hypothetical protein
VPQVFPHNEERTIGLAKGALHGTSFPGLGTPAKGTSAPVGRSIRTPIATREDRGLRAWSRLRELILNFGQKLAGNTRNVRDSLCGQAIASRQIEITGLRREITISESPTIAELRLAVPVNLLVRQLHNSAKLGRLVEERRALIGKRHLAGAFDRAAGALCLGKRRAPMSYPIRLIGPIRARPGLSPLLLGDG